MKLLTPLVANLLVTLLALPALGGAPVCGNDETLATPDGGLFVHVGDAVEVWEQSNVLPGLQRAPCDDGNGRLLAPDTQLL